jgi:hypothetical protein
MTQGQMRCTKFDPFAQPLLYGILVRLGTQIGKAHAIKRSTSAGTHDSVYI